MLKIKILKSVKISSFENISFIHKVNLILRMICFATLGDKMEKKLWKASFTSTLYNTIFLKIRQGRKNK